MTGNRIESIAHNNLDRIAHYSEMGSNLIAAATVLKSALEVLSNKSPKTTVSKGMAVAAAVRGISAICDLGVDAINSRNGLG